MSARLLQELVCTRTVIDISAMASKTKKKKSQGKHLQPTAISLFLENHSCVGCLKDYVSAPNTLTTVCYCRKYLVSRIISWSELADGRLRLATFLAIPFVFVRYSKWPLYASKPRVGRTNHRECIHSTPLRSAKPLGVVLSTVKFLG